MLNKGPAHLNDIDYLTLESTWYVKESNHVYRFKLWSDIINQYSYKYKFWDTVEKKIRNCQIYSSYSHFIGKGFSLEREIIKGLNLIVRLIESQTIIESFFLHRSPRGGTEYLNFWEGKSYYRDINL